MIHAEQMQNTMYQQMLGMGFEAFSLRGGFALQQFGERTGLPVTAIQDGLQAAEAKGLIERDFTHVRPTERGFDFLNDLTSLFLSPQKD